MRMTIDEFRKMTRDFQHSAFRWQTLDDYRGPAETKSLATYLSGVPKPPDHNARTYELARERVAQGMTMLTVKLIRRPLSDYHRYYVEWIIPDMLAAGWEQRIIDNPDRDLGLPDFDYWLYDDSRVVVLDYDEYGVAQSAELIEEDVEQYRRWRDIAIKESIPASEYRA